MNIQDGKVNLSGNGALSSNVNIHLDADSSEFDTSSASGNRSVGDLDGKGVVNTGANHLTMTNFNRCTFEGQFTGTGGIEKAGTETLEVRGDSTGFSGNSQVNGGCLLVNGILPCPIEVNLGCYLGGNGSVGPTINNGIVTPGSSIGTLTIIGNFTQGPGGTLQNELDHLGNTDLLIATGNANLDGTLEILPFPGNYSIGQQYTIIQAANVIGTFSNVIVTSRQTFTFDIFYFPTSVVLEILAAGGEIFPPCINANAERMAQFLEGCPLAGNDDLTQVVVSLLTLDQTGLDMALAGLTPAQFGAFSLVNYNNSRSVMNAFSREATKLYFCNLTKKPECKDETYCADEKKTTVWAEPVGSYIDQRMAEENFGFDNWNVGSVFGAHHLFGNHVFLGGGTSYIYSNLKWDHGFGKSDQHNIYGGIFSGYMRELWYILGTVLGSGNYYDVKRHIDFADIHRTAKNDHWGGEVTGRLEGGINFFNSKGFLLRPFVVVDSYNVFQQGYRESGSDSLNLFVKWNYLGMVRFNGTIQISQDFQLEKSCWTPLIYAGYVHETPVTRGHIDANLEGCCCRTLTVKTFHKDRDQFQGGAGLSGIFKNGASFSMNYEIAVGHKYPSHNGEIEFDWAF